MPGGKREIAARRVEEYQRKVKAYCRVRPRYIKVGDFVLRERKASNALEGGKLAQSWEVSYVISAVIGPRMYRLETTTSRLINQIWNSHHLVHFYQ